MLSSLISSSLPVSALLTSLLFSQDASADVLSSVSRAETAFNTLQTFYNSSNGIWNTCGWWNGANCMTVIADLVTLDVSVRATAIDVFNNTYTVAPGVNPNPGVEKVSGAGGVPETMYTSLWPLAPLSDLFAKPGTVNASLWLDGYYDDDAWWALAWIAAYDVTGNGDYLRLAEGIFDGMTKGWPTTCNNGGIWWDSTKTYVNAIANELFLSVAAHLANRAENSEYYINWAKKEWEWFLASGMINSGNTINDGLTTDCKNNGATVWSYNQGVVLGGLVELNKASPDPGYLANASNIAHAAISALTDSNHILHDPCEPNCEPDATQFKGIFMRNLQLLQQAAPSDAYVQVIQASANSIWNNDRNKSSNLLGVDWAGPFVTPADASTHSSAMDALVAAIVA
ncbi:glycosyl hydrolase, putative [Paecilomyces variotii No. 5]|uniref:Glycosyl hydrolase, putative n=1 Tax=Byssochlamys spectabilis (strain No. 5 / NBRC 109023) TaxID=1356009 RepID=V5FC61_BYSSN|nr:glycosyl hydrolase, putative [Paecilomyces variotii No. 5]